MKYSKGDRVIFNPQKAVSINTNSYEKNSNRRIGIISKVHPEEGMPYDITNAADQAIWVGDNDCIIGKKLPRCDDCGAEKIYHDKKEIRVCPWCDIQ